MDVRHRGARLVRWALLAVLGSVVVAVPAAGVPKERPVLTSEFAAHLSQAVSLRYWAANPEVAPAEAKQLGAVAQASKRKHPRGRKFGGRREERERFNADALGLPQNEESITACRSNTRIVLGGTNDYRGLVDPLENFTGWHLSLDGGRSLANEGLLPAVRLLTKPAQQVPSGGDPVTVAEDDCDLYAGSLAFDPEDPFFRPNGVAVYKTRPETLASCPGGGSNPSCWPTRRLVAEGRPGAGGTFHFLDKEWIYVGRSGGQVVVWIVYSNFLSDPHAPLGFSSAEIEAVRCDENLTSCTRPIKISDDPVNGPDRDVQFGDVTIDENGRVYITWSQIVGELEQEPQTFVYKLRVADAGSTTFGPERVVHVEDNAIPFGGHLQANDFRVATVPKNEVAMVGGRARVFLVWDACRVRPLPDVCEEPLIKLKYSDDDGVTWSPVLELSRGGVNYFPTISTDRHGRDSIVVAWYTNMFDPAFHNEQDVVLTSLDAARLREKRLKRLTAPSNESEADPLLGGLFIGDYIEVFAHRNRAWVHYNANYRQTPMLLGQLLGLGPAGVPVNQQDNYLARTGAH